MQFACTTVLDLHIYPKEKYMLESAWKVKHNIYIYIYPPADGEK